MPSPIVLIHRMGAQVIIQRTDQDRQYYPTRPSLQQLTKTIRSHSSRFAVLPFLDGWTAFAKPGYHKSGSEMLNILAGNQDVPL